MSIFQSGSGFRLLKPEAKLFPASEVIFHFKPIRQSKLWSLQIEAGLEICMCNKSENSSNRTKLALNVWNSTV